MNKRIKIFGIVAVILSLAMCLVGCGSNEKINKPDGSDTVQEKLNIEDIAWSVNEGIVDGDRYGSS